MEYSKFIKHLKSLNSTSEVLNDLYFYFCNFVEYDYDQLQVIKFTRYYENPMLLEIFYCINKIKKGIISCDKSKIIQMIDDAFIKTSGFPLTDKNKKNWFKNFESTYTLNLIDYKPVYEGDMLKRGVCGEYSVFIKRICDDLNIPCLIVIGRGTTVHAWNLIYDENQDKWLNFDITMVKFYMDGFLKNCDRPSKWINANFDEIFSMQPEREIHQILDGDNVIFDLKVTKDNTDDIKNFLASAKGIYKHHSVKVKSFV